MTNTNLHLSQVVLGMVLAGQLPPVRGVFLFIAEIIGCLVASGLVQCMFPGDINLVNTTLSNSTSIAQGVFIEMFLTCLLLFTILMLAAEKSKATFLAPFPIGRCSSSHHHSMHRSLTIAF